jgi:hypothetical protein
MKNRQTENLHTIQQIKDAGNYILSRYDSEPLKTQRGKTITTWHEKESGLYTPVSDKTIF